jgi:glycosyltransferase involved in cell wall biosynthesis
MAKTSIIIPSRNERYLCETVGDIFVKARGEIEVIVVLDGPTVHPLPVERPNLTFISKSRPEGLRPAIKDASYAATGKYLLKVDAHSMVSEGFDEVLKRDCEEDWVVVSRYYALDAEKWERKNGRYNDYFYLGCPWVNHRIFSFQDIPWRSRNYKRGDIAIDETMTMQASLWFMTTEHFHSRLGDLDFERWGAWSCEQQEISLKTWLGGGKVMINKNVWNAHYERKLEERFAMFPEYTRRDDAFRHRDFARYFVNDRWEGQVHKFGWLIDRFWPLPTPSTRWQGEKYPWPDNWRELYENKIYKTVFRDGI